MSAPRTILAAVTVTSLFAVPAAATAVSPTQQQLPSLAMQQSAQLAPNAAQAAGRYNTRIRFLDFDHSRPFMRRVTVRGQVVATIGTRSGGVRGVRVKLYRKTFGTSTWRYVDTTRTRTGDEPKFRFTSRAVANSTYRVVFAGNRKLQPARDATSVLVNRVFGAKLEDRTGRFHGQMGPRYAHRVVHLERRGCGRCGWHSVRSDSTGDYSVWNFKLGAPPNGRTWWRVRTSATQTYIRSLSGVWTTERR